MLSISQVGPIKPGILNNRKLKKVGGQGRGFETFFFEDKRWNYRTYTVSAIE